MSSTGPTESEAQGPSAEPGRADPAQLALLRQAQSGDRAAYGQLVLAYQDRLYNAVLRLMGDGDEAAEVTQEAFMRGLGAIGSFRGDAGPYTWLFRIAMNLAISRLRRRQRHPVFSLDGAGDGNGSGELAEESARPGARPSKPLADLERRETHEQVVAALGRVDAEYRAVLVMRDIEGFDYQQMAEVLQLPLGTVKSRLFRARSALRDQLKAYMDGE